MTLVKLREGGFLISKIKQTSQRIFDRKLKDYGIGDLNNAQGRIVFSLWQDDNMPISELARRTALGKTTLTSMLDRLEQSGHIIRKLDSKDKRKTLVALSEKSKLLQDRYADVSAEMTSLFYEDLPEKQISEFEDVLRRILSNLVRYEEDNK